VTVGVPVVRGFFSGLSSLPGALHGLGMLAIFHVITSLFPLGGPALDSSIRDLLRRRQLLSSWVGGLYMVISLPLLLVFVVCHTIWLVAISLVIFHH